MFPVNRKFKKKILMTSINMLEYETVDYKRYFKSKSTIDNKNSNNIRYHLG